MQPTNPMGGASPYMAQPGAGGQPQLGMAGQQTGSLPPMEALQQLLMGLPPEMLMQLFASVMGGMGGQQQPSMSEIGGGLQDLLAAEMGRAGASAHRFPGEQVDEDVGVFMEASEQSPLQGLLGAGGLDFAATKRARGG
jgi:hypothetical protein